MNKYFYILSKFLEKIMNSSIIVIITFTAFYLGYKYYSRYISEKIFKLDETNKTPAHQFEDGIDFVPLGAGDVNDTALVAELLRKNKPFSLELPFRLHRDANAQPWRDEQPLPLDVIEWRISRSLMELEPLDKQFTTNQ